MRRECRERFPRHRRQRKPLVSDPGMHHATCVMHVPRAGKTVQAFPAHAQPAILRIWQEVYSSLAGLVMTSTDIQIVCIFLSKKLLPGWIRGDNISRNKGNIVIFHHVMN